MECFFGGTFPQRSINHIHLVSRRIENDEVLYAIVVCINQLQAGRKSACFEPACLLDSALIIKLLEVQLAIIPPNHQIIIYGSGCHTARRWSNNPLERPCFHIDTRVATTRFQCGIKPQSRGRRPHLSRNTVKLRQDAWLCKPIGLRNGDHFAAVETGNHQPAARLSWDFFHLDGVPWSRAPHCMLNLDRLAAIFMPLHPCNLLTSVWRGQQGVNACSGLHNYNVTWRKANRHLLQTRQPLSLYPEDIQASGFFNGGHQ